MGIKCNTSRSYLDNINKQITDIIREEIKRTLSYLGEQCVARVRDRSAEESWIDQTGNLRSSIGYAVYDQGRKAMQSAFAIVKQGAQGAAEGQQYIDSLAKEYAKTYALVVVAGMNYAEYVEARDNKDVLASTELWAKAKVEEYMKRSQERAERRINGLLSA